MANRQNTLLIKRSNIVGKIPPLSGLTLGELALNTADAKLYTLFTSGTTGATEVREIGWDRIHRTGDTVNGDFNFYGDIEISGSSQPSGYVLSVTGDTNFVGDIFITGNLTYDGDLIISGGTFAESGLTATTITISTTPTLNNNLTQILGRNETTGDVEYRNVNTIGNNYTYVSGATYSALTTDNVIGVDTSISATTVYLPDSITSGRLRYDIKDIGLNSFNNNITIVSSGSDTIISTENSNTVILESDGGALIIFNTGTGTWLQM